MYVHSDLYVYTKEGEYILRFLSFPYPNDLLETITKLYYGAYHYARKERS